MIPTLAQMRDPGLIPTKVTERLGSVGLSDTDPINLFRITWHNQPVASGRRIRSGECDRAAAGTHRGRGPDHRPGRQVVSTGAHKVGAAFGCLVPRLVTGGFDPTRQRRCGPRPATTAAAAHSIRVSSVATPLPSSEGMSREQFTWLEGSVPDRQDPEVQSNVKEIFDAYRLRLRLRGRTW